MSKYDGSRPKLSEILLPINAEHHDPECAPTIPPTKPGITPDGWHEKEFPLWAVIGISLAGVLILALCVAYAFTLDVPAEWRTP